MDLGRRLGPTLLTRLLVMKKHEEGQKRLFLFRPWPGKVARLYGQRWGKASLFSMGAELFFWGRSVLGLI